LWYLNDLDIFVFDTGDFIDARTALIDDWDDFDASGDIHDANVTVYGRFTDDDPAGAPTWGAWTPFVVADFTGRAAQFKAEYSTGSANHNVAISTLAVDAKIPA
jgi:hypothetical protein